MRSGAINELFIRLIFLNSLSQDFFYGCLPGIKKLILTVTFLFQKQKFSNRTPHKNHINHQKSPALSVVFW